MARSSIAAAQKGIVTTRLRLPAVHLTRAQRLRLLDGFERVIEDVFTHLPLKRARYGIDPVQRLRILRTQVDELSAQGFHSAIADIITHLRDAHTHYEGPVALKGKVAVLPFLIEMIGSTAAPRYIVTRVGSGLPTSFRPGVVLEYWNGVPIDRAVEMYSDREVGGRPDSERANAVLSLTFRSLRYGPPPDEHWVVVGYRRVTAAGKPTGPLREIRVPWRVVDPDSVNAEDGDVLARRMVKSASRQAVALRRRRAVNVAAEAVRRAKMLLFAPAALLGSAAQTSSRGTPARRGKSAAGKAREIRTTIPSTLKVSIINAPGGPYAHLRIWAFEASSEAFIGELLRILPSLPENGCIIDIRGNPGGDILASEQALQLFTPNTIMPTRFSLLATRFTRAMSSLPGMRDDLGAWRESLHAAVRTGELYAQPIPITDPADCNAIGQRYSGPVVLVGDATTYSAGDLFAAGFVDNNIGPFICVGSATGAGGANVWTYNELRDAVRGTPIALPALPGGIGLTVAFRRATRARASEGLPIEDVGIAGTPYAMTRRDVLHGNHDLIATCVRTLQQMPSSVLRAAVSSAECTISIATRGLDRLDVVCDGHPAGTHVLKGASTLTIACPPSTSVVELTGFDGPTVRQRRRLAMRR
jgi:Peptidase family S41